MKKTVFISGSISVKKLPQEVLESIDKIIANRLRILVGDANGVDRLVQEYCAKRQYYDVTVYSIYNPPRNKTSNRFQFKKIHASSAFSKERERQKCKDRAMTRDCNYCLVIWDGRSRGSYANILRAINLKKKTKVYLTRENRFLEPFEITKTRIESIFKGNHLKNQERKI